LTTGEQLAQELESSTSTVRRDAQFAAGIDLIGKTNGPEAQQAILSGKANLTQKQVKELAALEPQERKVAVQEALDTKPQAKEEPHKQEAAKVKPKGEKAKPAKATTSKTIVVPREPTALAKAVYDALGSTATRQVHQALGKLLTVKKGK